MNMGNQKPGWVFGSLGFSFWLLFVDALWANNCVDERGQQNRILEPRTAGEHFNEAECARPEQGFRPAFGQAN